MKKYKQFLTKLKSRLRDNPDRNAFLRDVTVRSCLYECSQERNSTFESFLCRLCLEILNSRNEMFTVVFNKVSGETK